MTALALGGTLLICLLLAWAVHFVQDDAFISFRYARYLAEGHGLVWNPGERIEGYTNFLWVMLMAGVIRLGGDPVLWSQYLGIACFAGSLIIVYVLMERLGAARSWRVTAVALTGLNYSFLAYATSGLETPMQALLALLSLLLVQHALAAARPPTATLIALSLVATAALMIRMDAALYLTVLYGGSLLVLWRRGTAWRELFRVGIAACLPALLLVSGWLIWKLGYYGHILPNTYFAKTGGETAERMTWAEIMGDPPFADLVPFQALVRWFAGEPGGEVIVTATHYGIAYLLVFAIAYGFVLLVPIAAPKLPRVIRSAPLNAMMAAIVLIQCLYVIRIGGDFMEFRFMVPQIPMLLMLLAQSFERLPIRAFRILLVLLVLGFSVNHALTYRKPHWSFHSITFLKAQMTRFAWPNYGRALHENFGTGGANGGDGAPVMIATTAAGAIPYFAQLPTVDMLGLNDAWIARHGRPVGVMPGHARLAPVEYMRQRGVNLVVGHPWADKGVICRPGAYTEWDALRFLRFPSLRDLSTAGVEALRDGGATILEMPFADNRTAVMLYLTPHPLIEARIADGSVTRHPILRDPGGVRPNDLTQKQCAPY